MTQKSVFTLGVLEIAGIGLASGVSGGAIASLAGYKFDTVVPCCAAIGVFVLPVLWFGAGMMLARVIRRPRTTRAVTSTTGLVA